jgi:hypothetical protein
LLPVQQFNSAEKAQARLEKYNQGSLLVELGYNLQLQKRMMLKFTTTKRPTQENPNEVYGIASSFEKVLLDYALKSRFRAQV